jgi:hypothetical protein
MRDLGTVKVISNEGNPTAIITRPNNTTAYDAGDIIGGNSSSILTFSNVLPTKGVGFIVICAWMKIAVNAVPVGMSSFRLHIYNASPTNIADGVAFNLATADLAKYLGYITLSTPTDFGDNLFTQIENINFKRTLATTSNSIYGMLQTVGAFTPSAQAVKTIGLEVAGA